MFVKNKEMERNKKKLKESPKRYLYISCANHNMHATATAAGSQTTNTTEKLRLLLTHSQRVKTKMFFFTSHIQIATNIKGRAGWRPKYKNINTKKTKKRRPQFCGF